MTELDERKAAVLRAIVEQYVDTAQPVGSQTVTNTAGLGVSAATVRNEMSVLEREGYITQPHTSAGRIPAWSQRCAACSNEYVTWRLSLLGFRTRMMCLSLRSAMTCLVRFASLRSPDWRALRPQNRTVRDAECVPLRFSRLR